MYVWCMHVCMHTYMYMSMYMHACMHVNECMFYVGDAHRQDTDGGFLSYRLATRG